MSSKTNHLPGAAPVAQGIGFSTQVEDQYAGNGESRSSLDPSSAHVVIEELKRIQDKMDNTAVLTSRLDKMSVLHNKQTDTMSKMQDALTSLRADVQHLHKVNGGSFAGQLETLETRLATFESSLSDMARESLAAAKENNRLVQVATDELNTRWTDDSRALSEEVARLSTTVERCRVACSQGERSEDAAAASVLHEELLRVRELSQSASNMAQEAFERSVCCTGRVLKAVDALDESFQQVVRHVDATTELSLRFPMVKHNQSVFMRHVSVDESGSVSCIMIPVEQDGVQTISFI